MIYEDLIDQFYAKAVFGLNEEKLSNMDVWYSHISNLPDHLKAVYTISTLHQQVTNGGFHQYFFNSYGIFAYMALEYLEKIKAVSTKKLLEKVLSKVNSARLGVFEFNEQIFMRQHAGINSFDDKLGDFLDKCDDEFYNFNEDLTMLLGEYLKSTG
jgi:hypothetical protein